MDSEWIEETPEERIASVFGTNSHKISSRRDHRYNCVAWVAGETHRPWDPSVDRGRKPGYWPPEVPRSPIIANLIAALKTVGFEVCEVEHYEQECDKIALIEADGEWQHACRICPDGWWWSKIGPDEDVMHDKAGIEEYYGKTVAFMKRPAAWTD